MREFKFRYTFERKIDNYIYQIIVPIECLEDGHGEIFSMLSNNMWVLINREQFTGFLDKQGKEICEGDIAVLKGLKDEIIEQGIVAWNNMSAAFTWSEDFTNYALKKAEIIGNVHDNPEILQENK